MQCEDSEQLSEQFVTQKGLRQGDALACLLFNIALEKAVRDSGIETRYYTV
jgi:sorting nexin-29